MKIPTARKLPSGSWFIQLRLDGQSISVTEPTEELCVAKAMAIKTGLIKIKRRPEEMTLGAAIDRYIKNRQNILSPATIGGYKMIRKHRFPDLMDEQLKAITAKKVQSAINEELKPNEKGKRASAKSIYNAIGLVKSVLSEHIDVDLSKLLLPKRELYIANALSPDEVATLLRGIVGHKAELPVLLAVWLGMRRSEIAALRRSNFDFNKGLVTVRTARVPNEDGVFIEKGTKTTRSKRAVECPKYILDKVESLPKDQEFIMAIHPNSLQKMMETICEKNGLPKIRFHDLRHIAASIMLMLNVPEKYAMERGGWSSKRTMQGIYQHTYDSEQKRMSAVINNYYESLLTDKEKESLVE